LLDHFQRFLDVAFDYPLMPAYKALLAHVVADDAWMTVRAPLVPLASQDRDAMIERLRRADVIGA